MARFEIDDELASFVVSGNAVIVATRSSALEPHLTRACGIAIVGLDRLAVLVPRATSAGTVANLEDNGEVAVCVSSPIDFRTYQLKGRCVAIADGSADDVLLAEQQLQRFADAVARFGIGRASARNLWLFDCWRVEIHVTGAFAQTPGPGAGARLGASDER